MKGAHQSSFKNDGRLKLLIIVGTRPEIIRLSSVIDKCRKYFDCLLAHTGQNYDFNLNGIFFKDLKIESPDIYMGCVGSDLGDTIGKIISKSYELMKNIQPDALLILGDTNSCLSAIAAKRLHIPIFHMEAGNRCKDECLPEETNRRIVDIISDVNLAMAEVLHKNLNSIQSSRILEKLGLQPRQYILLSAHREENIETNKNFISLFEAINDLAEKVDKPILYSCHPRSKKRLVESGFKLDKRVFCHDPLGFFDYNQLQLNAMAVISDSGTLPEESAFFAKIGKPFPAVCIRTSTERPEAMEKGIFVLAGVDKKSLLQAFELAIEMHNNQDVGDLVFDYCDENVSNKVIKIIQSYTNIVNKFVWRKN